MAALGVLIYTPHDRISCPVVSIYACAVAMGARACTRGWDRHSTSHPLQWDHQVRWFGTHPLRVRSPDGEVQRHGTRARRDPRALMHHVTNARLVSLGTCCPSQLWFFPFLSHPLILPSSHRDVRHAGVLSYRRLRPSISSLVGRRAPSSAGAWACVRVVTIY